MSKNRRRDAARDKARALRDQQKKKERRGRVLLQSGLIIATLAIISIVTIVIVSSVKPPSPGPRNMLSDGIVIGQEFTAVTTSALGAGDQPVSTVPTDGTIAIDIYLDYQCPLCRDFESANSELLSTLLTEGAATVEFHPISILDRASLGSQYSSRAANAAACVADFSPNSFFAFNSALYASQPDEQTAGLTNEELIALAKKTNVASSSKIASCINDFTFKNWVQDATERAVSNEALLSDGQFGTPAVLVNGVRYTGVPKDATAFAQFVASADGAGSSENAPTTPSPSPSPSA